MNRSAINAANAGMFVLKLKWMQIIGILVTAKHGPIGYVQSVDFGTHRQKMKKVAGS